MGESSVESTPLTATTSPFLLLIPSLPSLIAIDSILLALFYLLLLSLPSPSHPNRGRSRNITVRGTALLPFLCGSARSVWKPPPLSRTHPELGVQQKSPTERDRNSPYVPQFQMLQAGLQILPRPWVLVVLLWRREAGFAPQLPFPLPGVPPRLPLLSPPPLTHTRSLTHARTHSGNAAATAAVALLRGSPPLWRLAHIHTPQALYVHSSCVHRHIHRQPPLLPLTLHLH